MANFEVNFLILIFKIKSIPRKNSRPIKNRAIYGDVFQVATPISTNWYSNGSIGYILVAADTMNNAPTEILVSISNIFFIAQK